MATKIRALMVEYDRAKASRLAMEEQERAMAMMNDITSDSMVVAIRSSDDRMADDDQSFPHQKKRRVGFADDHPEEENAHGNRTHHILPLNRVQYS